MKKKIILILVCLGAALIGSGFIFLKIKKDEAAKAVGYNNSSEMEKSIGKGFQSSKEYFSAISKGFEDRSEYISAMSLGYKDNTEYKSGILAGFGDAQSFRAAKTLGFEKRLDFEAAVKGKFTNAEEWKNGTTAGFDQAAQYRLAKTLNYQNFLDFNEGHLKGKFTNAEEWKNATAAGFDQAAQYRLAKTLNYQNSLDFNEGQLKGYKSGNDFYKGRDGNFLEAKEYLLARSLGLTSRGELTDYFNGNKTIALCADGMTYERQKCEFEKIGKRLFFRGTVFNVESENLVTVNLFTEKGNYAEVYFNRAVGATMKKSQTIEFWATLSKVGTGIWTHHTLHNAELEK